MGVRRRDSYQSIKQQGGRRTSQTSGVCRRGRLTAFFNLGRVADAFKSGRALDIVVCWMFVAPAARGLLPAAGLLCRRTSRR